MSQAESILKALGGWENIADLEACITRIEKAPEKVDASEDHQNRSLDTKSKSAALDKENKQTKARKDAKSK